MDFGEEQWLDIAQAIHTIEMIPKSMILINQQIFNKFILEKKFYSNVFLHFDKYFNMYMNIIIINSIKSMN